MSLCAAGRWVVAFFFFGRRYFLNLQRWPALTEEWNSARLQNLLRIAPPGPTQPSPRSQNAGAIVPGFSGGGGRSPVALRGLQNASLQTLGSVPPGAQCASVDTRVLHAQESLRLRRRPSARPGSKREACESTQAAPDAAPRIRTAHLLGKGFVTRDGGDLRSGQGRFPHGRGWGRSRLRSRRGRRPTNNCLRQSAWKKPLIGGGRGRSPPIGGSGWGQGQPLRQSESESTAGKARWAASQAKVSAALP